MRLVILEHAVADGLVEATYYFDGPHIAIQQPAAGRQLYGVFLDGQQTDQEVSDLMEAKNNPGKHWVVGTAVKKQEILYPVSLVESAGFAAVALANFQAGGALALPVHNESATVVRVLMSPPEMDPAPGADLQVVTAQVGRFGASQLGDPTVRLEVWETGGKAPLVTSRDMPVSGARQEVTLAWNASLLGNADGRAVEVKVIGTQSGGSPGARNSVNIGPICWKLLRNTHV